MRPPSNELARSWWRTAALGGAALSVGCCVALARNLPAAAAIVAGSVLYVVLAYVSIRRPLVFVTIFLLVLELLPPFFFSAFGEAPVYLSTILIPIGLAILILRFPEFSTRLDPVAKGLMLFVAALGISLPFAAWLSSPEVTLASLLRWLLLGQACLIYLLIRHGSSARESSLERWLFTLLLVGAVISATYGVFDFVWPIPLPHPAADQFIWLRGAVLRRAQGVFYESSNFGNFCGFFLAAASAAYLSREGRVIVIPRPILLLTIAVLSLAVLVAFSRSTWASVLTTLGVFVAISGQVNRRRAAVFLLALASPILILWIYSPELWDYLVSARVAYLAQILADPNLASSGRYATWQRILAILQDQPQYLLFGVGYKTLPYTRLFHDSLITDNGYLSLLLETGIVGLGSFLIFSVSVLKTFLEIARKGAGSLSFMAAFLFAFWCGECVQLLAVDALTYWRNIVLFTALMALTINQAERQGVVFRQDPTTALPRQSGER